jgi:formiminotetrahydrofolate cyclodeaminase
MRLSRRAREGLSSRSMLCEPVAVAHRETELPSIGLFLRAVGGGDAAKGSAGEVAALLVGLATDLAAQVAGASPGWSERGGALAQADTVRERALALATEHQHAYRVALAELSRALETTGSDEPSSEPDLGEALARVVAPLLALGEAASDAAELAKHVARSGSPVVRPDAVAATMLATVAAEISVHLIDINLLIGPDDERSRLAHELSASAARNREVARSLPR